MQKPKSHPLNFVRAVASSVLLLAAYTTTAQTLTHRWSFGDTNDSVGHAGITLVGSTSISGGVLTVGGHAGAADYASVDISSDFTNYASATMECWFTETVIQDWSKVWMFGNGGVNANAGTTYIDFTPNRGNAQAPGLSITPFPFSGGDVAVA